MSYRYSKDDATIFFDELKYNFQCQHNFILFQYRNVAEKSSRKDTATVDVVD